MKKNLKYEVLESVTYVNAEGLVTHIDQKVRFTRGELIHEARRVEIFYETKKTVVLLTNNFEFTVEDIAEIYRLRWAAFSQVITMVRLMLMYYVDFIAFMENPEKTWTDLLAKKIQKAPPEPSLFD